jgi:hypothetical protein
MIKFYCKLDVFLITAGIVKRDFWKNTNNEFFTCLDNWIIFSTEC